MELLFLDLLMFVGRLLSVKSQQISHFISLICLAIIKKLKPMSFAIEPILLETFDELIAHNGYSYDFFGDFHSCALLSINTLVVLSAANKSWLKLNKLLSYSDSELKEESGKDSERFLYKIAMPPVEIQECTNTRDYYSIQCLCVSNLPKDFVLYVTNVKLFNIVSYWNNDDSFCDLMNKVNVECDAEHSFPSVAKSAVVSAVATGNDISAKDFGDILDDYFSSIKLLKVGEVFHVRCGDHLRSRADLCFASDVYFKVVTLNGQSDVQDYFILKGSTDLYLNPPVHSYLPSIQFSYIKTQKHIPGFEISKFPNGLCTYFEKLKKIFKFLIKHNNIQGMLLLSGTKGSGKKIILKAINAFFGLNFLKINCFDFYGINSSLVQRKLDQISAKARILVPCVIYLENVELLGREQNYRENARMIDIFESHIRELWIRKPSSYPLIVVGSTQLKPTELVPSIARLFIHTISFDALKHDEAYKALKWVVKSSNMISSSTDLKKVADKIKGYFYADIILLTQHAVHTQNQSSNIADEPNRLLCLCHFNRGIEIMEAAYSNSIRAAKVPTVLWNDIGGLEHLKEEIMLTLNLPIQHPELFTCGLKRSGILFYGPPGTGKTLMAKAVATECSYNFLSVKGPELMNMYVGQSEKNVREVFERAREASPCIIFFDELDSLAPSRGRNGDSGGVSDRVVSQLLAEMDGLDKNKDVFVIGATNRPDLIDQALLRPGRFDKMFYVGVCKDKDSKLSVLKALTRKFSLQSDVNLEKIIEVLPTQVTGADLYSLCSNAWFAAARRHIYSVENGAELSLPLEVASEDFTQATLQFVSSLTPQDVEYFENLKSTDGNYF